MHIPRYGGPYLLEGQLGDPDPGCGGRDLFEGLSMFVDGQYFDYR
jgi:hypothetical protein